MTEVQFLDGMMMNPAIVELLPRLRKAGLKDCYLTAGCLFQTLWNQSSGRAADWGVKDYDVFYFDDSDLSWCSEDEVIRRVAAETADIPITVDVKNQARVHLWYAERFGGDYPQLKSSQDGIDRYLVSCTCVGIEVQSGKVYTPDGLHDLARGVLRMNLRNPRPNLFRQKAEDYRYVGHG
jgi:hypothetical protein